MDHMNNFRGYGDANVPPTITVEGRDLGSEEEEQVILMTIL